jgi:hypothetical protein
MKVVFNGKKQDFAQVLANWLAKDARWWNGPDEPKDSGSKTWNTGQLEEVMGSRGPEHLLELLQLMVSNRHMFETMIAFSARYKSAVGKAAVADVQEALDLIKVMEVQQK